MIEFILNFLRDARLDPVRIASAIAFALIPLGQGCGGGGYDATLAGPDASSETAASGARATSATTGPASGLRIATSGDYPPFSHWPDSADAPRGFSVELAQAYARSRKLRVEWVRFRWPELAQDLAAGRFDLALSGVTVRADRSIAGRFSLPVTTSGAVLLVPANDPPPATSELNQASVRIAVNAGGHLERVARRLFPAARIEAVADNDAVLARLDPQPGRPAADAVLTDSLEAPLWLRARGGLQAIGPLTRDRKAAWFPIAREDEARRFDRWLLELEATGELARLRRRHGLAAEATARPTRALLASLDERLSLMTDVARSKQLSGAAVEDPAREERVLGSAGVATREAAERAGRTPPDPAVVDRFFRAQIEAAKWIQRRFLAQADASDGPDGPAPFQAIAARRAEGRRELEQRIRPALLFLGDRIAMLVVESVHSQDSAPSNEEVSIALARHDLPEGLRREIAESLRALLRDEIRSAPAPPPPPAGTDRAANA